MPKRKKGFMKLRGTLAGIFQTRERGRGDDVLGNDVDVHVDEGTS